MGPIDVICVGSAKFDTLTWVDHQPREDERILAEKIVNAAGGNANTAAAAVARQGVSVALCTTLGCDPQGDYLVSCLENFGVDARFVTRRPDVVTPLSINVACGASKTRSIITVASPPLDLSAAFRAQARWFHFDAEGFAAARETIRAGKLGGRVSIDAGISIGTRDLTGIDLYVPTKEQLIASFGGDVKSAMAAAVRAGAKDVVVTLGSDGAAVLSAGQYRFCPAYPVDVVSTLGAGDVFHGALVAALVRGFDLFDAVRCASVSAALACRSLDGQSAIPSLVELDQHLARYARQQTEAV
jgi:sugar/nucleoside kinase (ribokinase family)